MVEARRWHRLGTPLVALTLLLAGGGVTAGADYQGSVYSNVTAFDVCDGTPDTISTDIRLLARDAFKTLGYKVTSFELSGFTKANVLKRNPADAGAYVHSHGDFYGAGDIQGFREDGDSCSQAIVYATEIKKGRKFPANLVVMSTCHLAEAPRGGYPAMSEAYGIEQLKSNPDGSRYRGNEFFLGYRGLAWTSDQLRFEGAFWAYATGGWNLGDAFVLALTHADLRMGSVPDWFGQYTYSGRPQPVPPCATCL